MRLAFGRRRLACGGRHHRNKLRPPRTRPRTAWL